MICTILVNTQTGYTTSSAKTINEIKKLSDQLIYCEVHAGLLSVTNDAYCQHFLRQTLIFSTIFTLPKT